MTTDPAEPLLQKLCGGETAAAEEVFELYGPYLRMVIRRNLTPALRSKFDSVDVVQSVWADLLQGLRNNNWSFADAGQLRAFLVRATQNRFIDRVRQNRTAVAREQPLTDHLANETPSPEPRPSQLVQAQDVWDQLLAHCSPGHRPVLHLKRQGCSLAEIAAATGLHSDSIRRILRDLARRVATSTAVQMGQRAFTTKGTE